LYKQAPKALIYAKKKEGYMKMGSFVAGWTRRGIAGLTFLGLLASVAFGQGGVITVSKNKDDDPQCTTIQDAVNKAEPGNIIEILDDAVYLEQVTIDGREKSPWAGVVGGKSAITIRSKNPLSQKKPVIRYRDTKNTSPTSNAQAKIDGDQVGQVGNRETNAALRILSAQNVTIDGITVDGESPFVFGATGVWCPPEGGNCSAMFHGNSAIAVVVSGGTVIRNCETTGAFFGISVKDRNTGGIFANRNAADIDVTVPLSGFGKTGAHLFEHNRIHDNAIGFFFESSWDLGVTVRYNLIYNNYFTTKTRSDVNTLGVEKDNQQPGAFLFKDMYISPVAIYNNTFFNNYANFIANWKTGGQHLIFNNIFGPSSGVATGNNTSNMTYMMVDHKFPARMKYNTFANMDVQQFQIQCQNNFCANNPDNPYTPGGCFVADVGISNDFAKATKTTVTMHTCNDGISYPPGSGTQAQAMPLPGAIIPGATGTGGSFPADANNKWLEVVGGKITVRDASVTLPALFQSTDPKDSHFLEPKWDEPLVIAHIKNKGWPEAGIRNPDGSMADLGAIPSSSVKRHTIVARIRPTDVVRITGTNATAAFSLKGADDLTNLKVKYIKWIYQIPDNSDNATWGPQFKSVPDSAVRKVTLPANIAIKNGNNLIQNIPVPSVPTGSNQIYGFFELTIEGTDKNGNTITSDIGFLPFRTLEYSLKIEILNKSDQVVKTVTAGEEVKIRITPMKGSATYSDKLDEIAFSLLSNPGFAMMWKNETTPFISVTDHRGAQSYPVFFKVAGEEVVSGAGTATVGGSLLPFLGMVEVTVKPGPADHVTFIDPIPLSQLCPSGSNCPPATTINRGAERPVVVAVQDKYNNAVEAVTRVDIVSSDPNIGDVGAPGAIATKYVNTGANGIATFGAVVTNGEMRQEFDMTATVKNAAGEEKSDKGRLRIGRALDRLEVLFSDAPKFDPTVNIDGKVGEWYKITVRVVVGDTVNTTQNGKINIIPDNNELVFSATEGGAAATEFTLKNGVVEFWVGAPDAKADISACIDVEALSGGIGAGSRCGIYFKKPSSSILNAVVYGDGHGRPDSLLIYFDSSAGGTPLKPLPDKVVLKWPPLADGIDLTATAVSAKSDFVLLAAFTGARPSGYTSIVGNGRGLVAVHGGVGGADAVDEFFDVLDGIGPVIASSSDAIAARGNPTIMENPDPGVEPDIINIMVSEQIKEFKKALEGGNSLFYIKGPDAPANEPGASGGTALTVTEAFFIDGSNYQVVVEPIAGGLQSGDWIRFNPAGNVADAADNKSRSDNRWSQLDLQEKTPEVREAWYTSSVLTGKPDTAYVVFDKSINLAAWFSDGSVNFGKQDVVDVSKVGLASLFTASGNTLKIDLATAFKTSQSSIRTSEDMPFTLGYASSKKDEWGASVNVQARDRAKPVLADTVLLYIGDIKDDGSATTDTLRVTYSERPSDEALQLGAPVTIQTSGGACEPALKLFGQVVPVGGSSRFYRATYLVEGDLNVQCPAFPETGNMVKIDSKAGVGDDRTPSNVQDAPDNLKQPLRVVRELKWTVRVKSNPFKSDANGSRNVTVEMSPNAKGVANVNINASIMVFDNLGALVKLDTLKNVSNKIDWVWNGTNQKGRLVGTGTYLFKAVCDAAVEGDPNKQRYSVTRSLGVVRGKS
jgi:flagellar hook assembly protein FlgD